MEATQHTRQTVPLRRRRRARLSIPKVLAPGLTAASSRSPKQRTHLPLPRPHPPALHLNTRKDPRSVIHQINHGTYPIYLVRFFTCQVLAVVVAAICAHAAAPRQRTFSRLISITPRLARRGRHQAQLCIPPACTGRVPYLGLNECGVLGLSLPRRNSIPLPQLPMGREGRVAGRTAPLDTKWRS